VSAPLRYDGKEAPILQREEGGDVLGGRPLRRAQVIDKNVAQSAIVKSMGPGFTDTPAKTGLYAEAPAEG